MARFEDRYAQFLEEILRKTKNGELSWKYLDEEKRFYMAMGWVNYPSLLDIDLTGKKSDSSPDFDTANSFCSKIQDTFLVLLVQHDQPATFYVIPSTLKNIVTLNADEYGVPITRLLNMVRSFFPDGEAFIDSILRDSGPETK